MIYPPKFSLLANCFFSFSSRRAPEQPLEYEWRSSDINSCLNEHDPSRDYISQLEADSIILTREDQYCNLCGTAAENCDLPNGHDHVTNRKFKLQEKPLVENWVHLVRENELFRTISEPQRIQKGHWSVDANFKRSKITFQVFLDANLLRKYNFQPKELEFGIAFLPSPVSPSDEYLFDWFEPLDAPPEGQERPFLRNLDNLVEQYENAITARIVSQEAVQGFTREVRSGVWKSLKALDFEPSTEVSRCDGYRQYGIKPQDDDFVAIRTSEDTKTDLLFCRCSKGGNSIHVHLFKNGNITSPENDESINQLIEEINDKIDTYRNILAQQENINRFLQVVSVLAAIVPLLFIVQFIFDIVGILGEVFPASWEATTTISGLILLNILFVGVLTSLVVYPYVRRARFSWSIQAENTNNHNLIEGVKNNYMKLSLVSMLLILITLYLF